MAAGLQAARQEHGHVGAVQEVLGRPAVRVRDQRHDLVTRSRLQWEGRQTNNYSGEISLSTRRNDIVLNVEIDVNMGLKPTELSTYDINSTSYRLSIS